MMKTGITFFTVICVSFSLLAADQPCSATNAAQNSCKTGQDYIKQAADQNIRVDYTPIKKAPTTVVPQPTVVQPTSPSVQVTDLRTCLQKWDQVARLCVSSAEKAKQSCDQKNSEDSGIKDIQNLTEKFSSSNIAKNSNRGSSAECAQASLIGNTAINGLELFKNSCNDDFAACNSDCASAVEATEGPLIAKECLKYAATDAEQTEVVNTITRIIAASRNGANICMVEAKAEKDILSQMLSGFAKSTQAAKVCVCKLAAGGGSNCESIPNPTNCLAGGAMAGSAACNVYAADNCALGSAQFGSVPCQCLRDNTAAICRTAAATPAPSNFSMDLKNSPSSASGGLSEFGSPDDSAGKMNLDGGYGSKKLNAESKPEDPEKPSASGYAKGSGGAGPGGTGGNSSSGAGADPAASADDGSGKTGLAGLFNQVKSSFGMNKASTNSKTGKNFGSRENGQNGSNYNLDKWRPRGPASANCQASQMRCKNEDIFLIMNKRYDVIGMSLIKTP